MTSHEISPIHLPPEVIEELDPKIRELVIVFNEKGIPTYSSCEGHLNTTYRTRKLPYPWITFSEQVLTETQASQISRLIDEWNDTHPSERWEVSLTEEQLSRFKFLQLYCLAPEVINFDLDPELLNQQQNQASQLAQLIRER